MKSPPSTRRPVCRAFTLVELMIVVAVIALLAAIAVPSMIRARKRAQGVAILTDLRLIDSAMDQYGTEYVKPATAAVPVLAWRAYLKPGSRLYTYGTSVMGDVYGDQVMGVPPAVPSADWDTLLDACNTSFWAPFVRSN